MARSIRHRSQRPIWGVVMATAVLTGCENLPEQFKLGSSSSTAQNSPALAGGTSLRFEERDIEAPEVFDVTDTAVWDGKPSFGGVWVAYPGETQPERVTITNIRNGKSVVGALFKSEKDNPGPKIKLSSDAAEELGVLAGEPTEMSIVAIRRQPVQLEPPPEPVMAAPVAAIAPVQTAVDETAPIETKVLTQSLAAAIETAPKPRPQVEHDVPAVAPVASPPAPVSDVPSKPFIQVATLTSEANATTLEKKLSDAGITSLVRVSTTSKGKDLYRVLAGPAVTQAALRALSEQVSNLGFTDAFPVTN